MLHIVICDDEKHVRDQLRRFLRSFLDERSQAAEILEFESADALLKNYPQDPDLLLLDIRMHGTDGIAAAKKIRSFDTDVCIIFITTMFQRAIEGYSVRAFGFIRKPVSVHELRHELNCALVQIERNREHGGYLTIRSGGSIQRTPIRELSYCEVRNHNVLLCLDNRSVVEYRGQLKELEPQLQSCGFLRCHASFLVNSKKILQISASSLTLKNGAEIPISQRKRREFLDALSQYIGEQI